MSQKFLVGNEMHEIFLSYMYTSNKYFQNTENNTVSIL